MNAETKSRARRALSILVADDDADTVRTLAAILENEGHVVHRVHRGDLALEAFRRYRPEVCILDIEMPGRSGYAVAEEITRTLQNEERPFLIGISGRWTKSSDRLLAESLGFDKYLLKPADPEELVGYIDEIATGGNSRP